MPIIHSGDIPSDELSGNKRQTMVNGDLGADSLTVFQLDVPPGGEIPLHIHPGHEEAMIVVEGTLEAIVDDHVEQVGPGDTILAPSDSKHSLTNKSDKPARFIAIFPTTDVQRHFLDS